MNNMMQNETKSKDLTAIGCIAASVIGLFLGIRFPQTVGGVFSIGTILSFVGFLLSLGAVRDKGSNFLAIIAFTLSFLAMAITIFCSGMAS